MRQDRRIYLKDIELGILEEYLLSHSMDHVEERKDLWIFYSTGEFGHHSVTMDRNVDFGGNVLVNGKNVEKIVEFYRKVVVEKGLTKAMGD